MNFLPMGNRNDYGHMKKNKECQGSWIIEMKRWCNNSISLLMSNQIKMSAVSRLKA